MRILTAAALASLSPAVLIDALQSAFADDAGVTTPLRSVHGLLAPGPQGGLYLMPAWSDRSAAVKLITFLPDNPRSGRPAAQGLIVLFDRLTGAPTLIADGASVTNLRTAAVSALASRYLSREASSHLLILGAGALAPYLAQAHVSVRPIRRLSLWARRREASLALAEALRARLPHIQIESVNDLAAAAASADIISCATSASAPVLEGRWIRPGVHVDLVGAHSLTTREADDAVVARAAIWFDTDAALIEAGDLASPLATGAIDREQIRGGLGDLVRQGASPRSDTDVTVFKSVGAAIEDLAAVEHLAHLAEAQGWFSSAAR